MKWISGLIICLLLIPAVNTACQDLQKLTPEEVQQERTEFTEEFAVSYFEAVKKGESYQFTDNAIDEIKKQLTPENQKAAYNQIKANFGDYESLEYAETWGIKTNPGIHIIRFKSLFSQTNQSLEIRVVLNEEGKIAGFWIAPWSDTLN